MAETTKSTPNLKLRRERERRCWSQLELADMLGTTPLNVGRWERGITLPGPHLRQKLCEVFEKSASELGLMAEHADPTKSPHPSQAPQPANAPYPPASPQTPLPLWNVPYNRNPLFTGREDTLQQLRQALTLEDQSIALAQPQAISGLGGIGKTQTAVEYAYRFRDEYEAVFWARADAYDSLVSDFLLIAALLHLPQRNENEQSVIVKAVIHWFDTHENWLLILDNADDIAMVSECIPSVGKGHVLLTTRAHSTGTAAQRIELDNMGLEEGIVLLLRRAKILKSSVASTKTINEGLLSQAQAIVEAVDGLPLALDQAGAYIEETGCSLADYLKFYKTRRTRLLRMRGKNATGHPEPVATTWSLSFEKIEDANPGAAELLRLCAFLHPDAIPEAMIIAGAAELGPILQPVAEDEFELNEAIGELRKYSLVKRDPERKILNIHRLVQSVLQDAMDKEIQGEWAERTVHMINRVFPAATFPNWPGCQEVLPHAQIAVELIKQWNINIAEAAELLSRMGNYLRERAQYSEAEPLLQKALAIRQRVLGSEHVDVAGDMNSLAGLYSDVGKYAQAETLYHQARNMRERILGPAHPDVATTMNDLGLLYREQGRFAQAEPFLERALTLRIEALGTEHVDVAGSFNNLALIYGDLGKYRDSEALYQQALTIEERLLGSEHPEVATTLNNIGWLYYRQGRYDLVEAPHLRALAIREKGQGPDHPYVAVSLNALGLLYRDQGDYTKAEPFFQRALMIRERAFGPEHVDVAQSLQNLGALYHRQGKYDLAEQLLTRSLRIREQVGMDTPLVAYSLHPLAVLYRDRGNYEEAERLFQRALAIREDTLGKDNIDVAYTLAALAVLYRNQGRYDEAEPLFLRALAIQEQILVPKHPNIAQSLNELALLYSNQNQYTQAEPLYQRALTIQEQVLGLENPFVAVTLENYAVLLRKTGRASEATAMEARIQAIRAKQG